MDTATFDQVVGAAMRITEVCILNSRPDVTHWGGAALAGVGRFLDVIVWGTPEAGGNEGGLRNETVALTGSSVWVAGTSQS